MRKKKLWLVITVAAVLLLSANSLLFAQSVVLSETEIKEDDSAVKMLFSTNRSIPVECYDLSEPPQVIIDFMGEIYTNKPEIMMVNKGVVKQMRVIRGTKKSQDLDDSFYSVDFIIIDLKESMRYDFNQGLTTSVLVVSKPGKIFDPKKAQNEIAKIEPTPAPVAKEQNIQAVSSASAVDPQVSVVKKAPFSMEDKEYEMPVKSVEPAQPVQSVKPIQPEKTQEVKKAPKRKMFASARKGRVEKQKKQTTMAEKSEADGSTSVGKMKTGIKNFFTFRKGTKKESSEAKPIKEAQKPKPEAKKEVTSKSESKKRTFFSKRRQLKEREEVKSAEKPKVEPRVKKSTKATGEESVYTNTIAEANAAVEKKAAELDAAKKNMVIEADSLKQADSARKTMGQRIKENNAKQAVLKADYNESLKLATFAKNAANSTWMEYSEAKTQLSLFLKNEAEPKILEEAQKTYEQKKTEMSQAIKAAESAKNESEAKLSAYEKVVQEGNALLVEDENQKKNVGKEQLQYNTAEETVYTKLQELANAKKEVKKAERDYQQYQIDKAEEEYRKSLFNIDQTLALEVEKEKRRKEEEKLRMLEEERAEQIRIQQEMKAKEEAQLAALKQIQKNEEEDQKQFLRIRQEKVEPKRRVKPLATTEVTPEVVQVRTEVLQTAVELRNSGLEMQRIGDFDSAAKYYQQALISDPKYATVHNDLGILYEQKGLNEKAKMEYLEALKINPHYVRAHSNLALLYEKSGDNNKAYYHWKQRVQLGRPDDPWTDKAKQRMELLEQQRK